MRLGICNFAFPKIERSAVRDVLHCCDVIDFAPTVHGLQWDRSCPAADTLFNRPMQISCIQSIFFGIHDASLVKNDAGFKALSTHIDTVCRWANGLAAEGLVFGAPAMRSGCTESIQAIERRLLSVHEQTERCGQRLFLEAASPRFGTEFGASTASLLDLMTRFPQLHLHLDVGQMMEEGVDFDSVLPAWIPRIAHIHLSAPDLAIPSSGTIAVWKDVIRMMEGSQAAAVVEIQHISPDQSGELVDLMTELRADCFK